jgi:hypothetical protein
MNMAEFPAFDMCYTGSLKPGYRNIVIVSIPKR